MSPVQVKQMVKWNIAHQVTADNQEISLQIKKQLTINKLKSNLMDTLIFSWMNLKESAVPYSSFFGRHIISNLIFKSYLPGTAATSFFDCSWTITMTSKKKRKKLTLKLFSNGCNQYTFKSCIFKHF